MNRSDLSLFGLKWNPFSNTIPAEGLYLTKAADHFCWRVEHTLADEGGFAQIIGAPGVGKSVILRLLAQRLMQITDLKVGVLTHPSANLADFYREMGDLFGVELRPHNRWGGFKSLRNRWQTHLDQTRLRPCLLIDEAQEMHPQVLNELRLLTSKEFDSRTLLSVIFAGDQRFVEKLRREELLPLASRMRIRLQLERADTDELMNCLEQLQTVAGNPSLMTPQLMQTLCEHAAGNYRTLTIMASELLTLALNREESQMDEALFLEAYGVTPGEQKRRAR